MALAAHGMLGPYRILRLLGSGGMGEVYVARDDRLGRDVAIKILPGTYAADPDRLRRFDQEARATAALNHPNILAVFDIGTAGGAPYIVSELLHGRSLRDALGHGALASRKAVEYGIAVATGLAAAHERGIVHRDIKPENVFITDDGRVKILDFGLAKLREPLPGAADATKVAKTDSTEGMVVGTAGYMSPEQVRGQSPDHRSDIFSLGAMLYEMVSGQRAFAGDTSIETMSAILKYDPPLLSTTQTTISPQLASVIQRCLEKERDQRFQSARDLAFSLTRLSGTSSSDAVARPAAHRPRWQSWGLAAAAGALFIAVGAAAYLGRFTRESPPLSFQQLTFRKGQIAQARFAPDGQTVISSAAWEGKPTEVFQTRLDTGESTALPLPPGTLLTSVSRSGDLAVIWKNDVLARVPIGGAGPRDLVEHVWDADWAPDGSLAVIRREGGRSWLEFPQTKTIYEPDNALHRLRVSPDGTRVAVIEQQRIGAGAQWLTILDRNGTRISSQKWGSNFQDGLAWTPDGREVWFTASETGGRTGVHAMTVDGRERVVHRTMESVRILDVTSDGRALLVNDSFRADMSLVDMNADGERDLSWRDWSRPFALRDDGSMLAFGYGGRMVDGKTPGFIRPTNGAPAIQITDAGNPDSFSPDGKWVTTTPPRRFTLVPTGSGEPRAIDTGPVMRLGQQIRWMNDGHRIVFAGTEPGKPNRVYLVDINGGPAKAITPEGAFGPLVLSSDSTIVIVKNEKGLLTKYPVAGGPSTGVAGAVPGDQPLAWSPDGDSIWVLNRGTTPEKIFRIELQTGRRSLWRDIPYHDLAATVPGTLFVVMSADGSKFVYGLQKHLSELYLAEGLR